MTIRNHVLEIVTYCVKSVRIRSYSGPHFPAFGLNSERYGVCLRIQFKCGKIRTRKTPNTDTFFRSAALFRFFRGIVLPNIFLKQYLYECFSNLYKCNASDFHGLYAFSDDLDNVKFKIFSAILYDIPNPTLPST